MNYYNGWVAEVADQLIDAGPWLDLSDPILNGAADSRLSAGESLSLTSTYNGITTLAEAEALVMDYTSADWPEVFVRWDNTAFAYHKDRRGNHVVSSASTAAWGQDRDWASSQVVPEPSTIGLGAIGLLLTLRRRR